MFTFYLGLCVKVVILPPEMVCTTSWKGLGFSVVSQALEGSPSMARNLKTSPSL